MAHLLNPTRPLDPGGKFSLRRWWETGTQYAFQPHLPARLSVTPSKWLAFAAHVRKGGLALLGNGKVELSHNPGQGEGGGDTDRSDEAKFCLVAQSAEGHLARGKRVFFIT